jgi:hypothetical protein
VGQGQIRVHNNWPFLSNRSPLSTHELGSTAGRGKNLENKLGYMPSQLQLLRKVPETEAEFSSLKIAVAKLFAHRIKHVFNYSSSKSRILCVGLPGSNVAIRKVKVAITKQILNPILVWIWTGCLFWILDRGYGYVRMTSVFILTRNKVFMYWRFT